MTTKKDIIRFNSLIQNTPVQSLEKLRDNFCVSDVDTRVKEACIEDIDYRLNRNYNIGEAIAVDAELNTGEL